jgi:rod shape-determining protein MreC
LFGFFRSRIFILTLITVMLLIIIGVTSRPDSKLNAVRDIISVPLAPIQELFTSAGRKISDSLKYFENIDKLKNENEELKKRIKELENENRNYKILKDKNEQLMEALNLKNRFDDYEIIGGNIIAKDPGNWFNVFRIDRGTKDGINFNDTIVSENKGLVGRVELAGLTSAIIISVIDEGSVISARIRGEDGGYVRVRGDVRLKEKGFCRMDYIPFDVNVEVGDIIETSGLGGIYPMGIVIGKVTEVRKSGSDMSHYGIIKPEADLKKIEEVYILRKKNKLNGEDGK